MNRVQRNLYQEEGYMLTHGKGMQDAEADDQRSDRFIQYYCQSELEEWHSGGCRPGRVQHESV